MPKTMGVSTTKETELQLDEIFYPTSDGNRMAENTKQYEWITTIKSGLDSVFKHQTDVFIAGDLLWYPVEGSNKIKVAPDVMVAFGRPRGHRGSYLQWKEGNIAPQVVFEILSPGNTAVEMLNKHSFYAKYGVKEYYMYDPDGNSFWAYLRDQEILQEKVTNPTWRSPLLKVTFELVEDTLKIYDPNGDPFLTYLEQLEAKEKERAEKEKERAEKEKERAEKEKERAEKEKERAAKEAALKRESKEKAEKEEALKREAEALDRAAKEKAEKEEEAKVVTEKEAEIAHLKALLEKHGLKNI